MVLAFRTESVQNFRNLAVWQRSHHLALQIYTLSKSFPSEERFGVTSQLRRAAVSVPTNIAEGSKRRQPRDFAHFLNIAEGSLAEVEYLLILSKDLGYAGQADLNTIFNEIDEIQRMLNSLHAKVVADG